MKLEEKQNLLQSSLAFLGALQMAPVFGDTLLISYLPFTAALTGSILVLYLHNRFLLRKRWKAAQAHKNFMNRGVSTLNEHAMLALVDQKNRFSMVNENLASALGYSESEILGLRTSDIIDGHEGTSVREVQAALDEAGSWRGELCLRCADGHFVWVHATVSAGRPGVAGAEQTIIIASDITRYRRAMAERRVFHALDQLPDCVLLLDADGKSIRYVNKVGLQRRGWTADQLASKGIDDIGFGENTDEFKAHLSALIEQPGVPFQFETKIGTHDVEARLQVLDADTQDDKILLVVRDISREKEAIRVRREFIANVSHELRTPLTSIKGAMGLILSGATGDVAPKTESMVSIAHRNAERLVSIINDLLDIEKITAGQMPIVIKPCDLNTLMTESIQATQSYAEMFDVSFKVMTPDVQATVAVDADRTIQVLTNLLSNAAKFSRKGGEVHLTIEEDARGTLLKVRDFGKGVPPDELARIFERFSQSRKSNSVNGVRGTGLGLAIVKAIVEQQGGEVRFDSVVGEGSTVTVLFPADQSKSGNADGSQFPRVA